MKARVTVTLKTGVLDPQGKAIEQALGALGIAGVDGVGRAKSSTSTLPAATGATAESSLKMACEKLLANLVVENYRVEFV